MLAACWMQSISVSLSLTCLEFTSQMPQPETLQTGQGASRLGLSWRLSPLQISRLRHVRSEMQSIG